MIVVGEKYETARVGLIKTFCCVLSFNMRGRERSIFIKRKKWSKRFFARSLWHNNRDFECLKFNWNRKNHLFPFFQHSIQSPQNEWVSEWERRFKCEWKCTEKPTLSTWEGSAFYFSKRGCLRTNEEDEKCWRESSKEMKKWRWRNPTILLNVEYNQCYCYIDYIIYPKSLLWFIKKKHTYKIISIKQANEEI